MKYNPSRPPANLVVRKGGLEPPPLAGPDPKSGASANSATFAEQNNPLLQNGLNLFNQRDEVTPKFANVSFGVS